MLREASRRIGQVSPPRALIAVASVVLLAGISMSFVGAVTTGLSVDDPRHSTRLNSYFTNGLYVMKGEAAKSRSRLPDQAFVYGPVTALLQHRANLLVGNEDKRWTERTSAAYTTRHLVVAGLSLLGLAATGAIAALLLGTWKWGVLAASVLVAVPAWTGYSMFNGKDSPVGAGHTLATLGLIMLAVGVRRSWRWQLAAGLALVVGTVAMLGTRPGMWTSLAASVTLLLAVLLWARELTRRTTLVLFGSLVLAYFWLGVAYPRVYKHPLQMLWHSAIGSGTYEHLAQPNGRSYLPLQLLQEMPLILFGIVIVGAVAASIRAMASVKDRSADAAGFVLVASQAATLPVLGIVVGTGFYQGIRQVLFMVPALAVLATIGIAALLVRVPSHRAQVTVAVVTGLGLLLPMAAQARLHPYQYAYANAASDAFGVVVDSDPLGTSYRAQLPFLRDDLKVVCPQFAHYLARRIGDCRTRKRGQLSAYWQATGRPTRDQTVAGEFDALWRGVWDLPPRCHTTHELVRHRNLHRVVVSRVIHCQRFPWGVGKHRLLAK